MTILEGASFWQLYVENPVLVLFMVGLLLTGSYWIIRLVAASITVWICRFRRVRVGDGMPLDTLSEEQHAENISGLNQKGR